MEEKLKKNLSWNFHAFLVKAVKKGLWLQCFYLLTNLTSRFSGPIHRHLDGLAVDGHQGGHGGDDDVEVETLASSTSTDDS